MSAYIRCIQCGCDSLDLDALRCSCDGAETLTNCCASERFAAEVARLRAEALAHMDIARERTALVAELADVARAAENVLHEYDIDAKTHTGNDGSS